MKDQAESQQPPKATVQASEVTSAMIKNASASGDGSIKRSEEENIEGQKGQGINSKNEENEGTV